MKPRQMAKAEKTARDEAKGSAGEPKRCHHTLCSSLITKERHVMSGTLTVYHAISSWQAQGETHLSHI